MWYWIEFITHTHTHIILYGNEQMFIYNSFGYNIFVRNMITFFFWVNKTVVSIVQSPVYTNCEYYSTNFPKPWVTKFFWCVATGGYDFGYFSRILIPLYWIIIMWSSTSIVECVTEIDFKLVINNFLVFFYIYAFTLKSAINYEIFILY